LAVLPNIPGFLATIKEIPQSSVAPIFLSVYRYAWFVGFGLAFIFYLLLRGIAGSHGPANDVILREAKRSRRIPSN
jgi:cytosine/uracil/thiamine/allantoin permease